MKKFQSILNDVIGPVMRGPSSSHTAASWRIARLCLEILNEPLEKALVEFDKDGAWATNYQKQGTVMGINGGLLGLDITDPLMKTTEHVVIEEGLTINYKISSFPTNHTNTVRLSLEGVNGKQIMITGVSVGGGAFEIRNINNSEVKINGAYYELLVFADTEIYQEDVAKLFSEVEEINQIIFKRDLLNIKSLKEFSIETIEQLSKIKGCNNVIIISPLLPIIPRKKIEMSFDTIESLVIYSIENKCNLGDIGIIYEKQLSGLSDSDLFSKMKDIISIIEGSIKIGLNGTEYKDRILQHQSHLIEKASKEGKILQNSFVNQIVANVTAIMESKSALEVIVANPTAGSCGVIGGVIKAIADVLNSTKDEIAKSYFAAGIVGVYFAKGPGFSAEEHGCQVECGAASGMAAAAIAQLFGGTAKQAIDSASMAIQNMIGLICDPVADRVEVPCLGKNVNAAVNGLTSATMVCSGYVAVIPLDEVIETVSRVSSQMPSCVKCTGTGGLAITDTALKIKEKLRNIEH